jgi:hypothetical protein
MAAWGGVGVAGAALARVAGRELGRLALAGACAVAGLAFGAVMNLHMWVTYSGDHTTTQLAGYFATSLSFDVAHAVGNAVFCLAFGPAMVQALSRYRTRFEVTWLPAGAAAASALVLALAVATWQGTGAAAAASDADSAAARTSEGYLMRAQNDDGGWGAAPGDSSSQLYTGWTALGLAAAGRNPRDAGSPSAISYIRAHASELNDLGEVNRTILVLAAAGMEPRIGGRDLERELIGEQRPNGSFAGRVNTTAFAVLALRAAGRSRRSRPVRRAADWIAGQANDDGGFNFGGRGGQSGVDDTGAALQALAAAGRRDSGVVRRAGRFLVRNQASDGGFALIPGGVSNAQSTAWAVQGLLAAGRDPAKVRRDGSRDPMSYLRSLTAPSGEVRYSRTSRQTPVWVTAQALMALAGKPLPLAAVPRDKPARTTAAARSEPQPLPPVGRSDNGRDTGTAESDEPSSEATTADSAETVAEEHGVEATGGSLVAAARPAMAAAGGVPIAGTISAALAAATTDS